MFVLSKISSNLFWGSPGAHPVEDSGSGGQPDPVRRLFWGSPGAHLVEDSGSGEPLDPVWKLVDSWEVPVWRDGSWEDFRKCRVS